MHCPRLDHFVRFNAGGSVSRCGHMVGAPKFNSVHEMETSTWLQSIKDTMQSEQWPSECIRCKETELLDNRSIRLNSIEDDKKQTQTDYLIVGGVLDNVCNSACMTCNDKLSTKIGSLHGKNFPIVDNSSRFWSLPLHRVVHLDINGGEPSASKNYKNILANLPPSVKSVRINTNCSLIIPEIEQLLDRGVEVVVTVSLDGVGPVHDYIRWPIKWDKFYKNLITYQNMKLTQLNTWTTVSALNIGNLETIFNFVKDNELLHSWAFLEFPDALNVKYKNNLTDAHNYMFPDKVAVDRNNQTELDYYLAEQHKLRGMP